MMHETIVMRAPRHDGFTPPHGASGVHPAPPVQGGAGFTLTEIMIAVGLVSILAAMAVPQYRKTIELNYRQQAQDLLMTIYYGERAHRVVNPTYVNVPSTPPSAWNVIFMDSPQVGATPPITFEVTDATDVAFTATAARAGSGPCGGQTLTINQTRNVTGSWLGCP